jgi:Mrp family chromosome partitioning ATPase
VQLVDVIRSFRRHWRAALGIVVLVGVGLGMFLFTRNEIRAPDSWQASVQLLVPHRDEDGEIPEEVPPRLLQGQEAIALSGDTTGAALTAIGLDESARDDVAFEFEPNERGDILTLSATTSDPEQAEALADSYGTAYIRARRAAVAEGLRQQRMSARASVTALEDRRANVESELRAADPDLLASLPDRADPVDEDTATGEEAPVIDLPESTPLDTKLLVYERQDLLAQIESTRRSYARSSTESIVPNPHATVVERMAPEQITPEPPSPLIPIAVAIGIAAALALAVPVLLDRVDHSIRDRYTAANALAAPVLSTIPAPSPSALTTLARPTSPRGLAYRTLAAASIATDQLPRAIVVTAPAGTMQDNVAANFAAALADLGLRVALVATHARQAWYGEQPDGAPTLPDFLALAHAGRLNGEVRHHLLATPVENLRVLPAGGAETDTMIDGLPPLLRAFADAGVDVTVIAGPSILEDPSATILAWSTRSVLWVVEAGGVTQQQASEAAARLELAGASPFGVALVDGNG